MEQQQILKLYVQGILCVLLDFITQSAAVRAEAAKSLLETHNIKPYPGLLNQNLCLKNSPGIHMHIKV